MNKQLTAVECLIEQLECRLESLPEPNLFDQAKAMAKQQTIDSFVFAYLIGENDITIEDATTAAEKYYNEKYGKL